MNEVIEVSYTGDLLAHRRCRRAWAYEKHAGFAPYEQVQAMEGRLLHHAMEWLARRFEITGELATRVELKEQLLRYYRVLRSRGITTAFDSREEILERILGHLYGKNENAKISSTVATVVKGAQHSEYQLRSVRHVLPADFAGKEKIVLTGIIDLVLQQDDPLTYMRVWKWNDDEEMTGALAEEELTAAVGDTEIWDFKASRAKTSYLEDYVRQVATYAALYSERTGELPKRCVLFFVNEPKNDRKLLAVPIDKDLVENALKWTERQVEDLRETTIAFSEDPTGIEGGSLLLKDKGVGERVTEALRAQCTTCGLRFDCIEYTTSINSPFDKPKRDVDPLAVERN